MLQRQRQEMISTMKKRDFPGLRLSIPIAREPDSFPGQVTRSHKLQLKILHATTKTSVQPNRFFF